jgi:hypothetical protein
MSKTTTLYHRDGHEQIFTDAAISRMVSCGQVGAGKDWSSVAPPPPGWEREVPKYRARRDIQPMEKARFRSEPPFGTGVGIDRWQYGTREIKAGEIIETKEWPHESFHPLNYGAGQVLDFFNMRQKSRLPRSPWYGDRIRLDDGLSGQIHVEIARPNARPTAGHEAA